MSREFENQAKKYKDSLFIRTYLLLLASFIFGAALMMYIFTNASDYILANAITLVFVLLAIYLFCMGTFGNSQKANSVAEKTGNHEILILVIIVAGIVSAGIRKLTSAR